MKIIHSPHFFFRSWTNLSFSLVFLISFSFVHAQTLYLPGGAEGIGNTTYTHERVGIGTSNPWGKLVINNYGASHDAHSAVEIRHYDPNHYSFPRGIAMYVGKAGVGGHALGIDAGVYNSSSGQSRTHGMRLSTNQFNSCGANIGIEARVYGGGPAYGIYATASAPDCVSAVQFAGYFAGNIMARSVFYSSDKKLKHRIRPFTSALTKLMDLPVKEYEFRTAEYAHMNLAKGKRIGFLAQEVEKIFPELVQEAIHLASDSAGVAEGILPPGDEVHYKGVDYAGLTPYLTRAIQEQQALINAQQSYMQELEGELTELRAKVDFLYSQLKNGPTDPQTTGNHQLFQNYPNPSNGSTTIPYFWEAGQGKAHIAIYEVASGKQVGIYPLSQAGKGEVAIPASHLASGSYLYSLEVNGQRVASRLMMINR